MIVLISKGNSSSTPLIVVEPRKVALSVYREYIIALELVGFLMMAGIVGAAHIGQHKKRTLHRFLLEEKDDAPKKETEMKEKEISV